MRFLIQCGDHYENQSRIKSLVIALIECGHEPFVLVYKIQKGRLFTNLGAKTVSLSKHIGERKSNATELRKLNDIAVGDITYSELLRVEGLRRPHILWPGQIKKTLLDARTQLDAITAIIEEVKPDQCVIWNGFTGFTANVLRTLCEIRNIPSAFMERGLVKDSLFIDREGVNGASSLRNLTPTLLDLTEPSQIERDTASVVFNLQEALRGPKASPTENLSIFFPMQVQHDTNIILYCPFNTMRECLLQVNKELTDRLGRAYEITIRPHPEEDPTIDSNIPKFQHFTIDDNASLNDSIISSDLVITINSTVGLEALIADRPVVSLGGSIYSSCGLTYSLQDVTAGIDFTVNRERLIKYLCYVLRHNLVIPNCADQTRRVLAMQLGINLESSYKIEPLQNPRTKCVKLFIYVDLKFSEKLDLSYRKNRETITQEWIVELSKFHFDFDDFEILHVNDYKRENCLSLLVRSETATESDERFTKTVDIYGNLIH